MSVSYKSERLTAVLNVKLFLMQFRKAVLNHKVILIGGRKKNKEFITKLGWTIEDVLNFLFSELEPSHYLSGPNEEIDPNFCEGIIFKFKIQIETFDVYVKIKKPVENDYFVVISFHEGER